MRELKFRIWDRLTKSMLTDKDDWKYYLAGGVSIDSVWATKDVELMQYTDLKDKNGVEIYEGDIIMCCATPAWTGPRRICTVMWHKYVAGFDSDLVKIIDEGEFPALKNNQWGSRAEVIGNIHQNPELLK